MRKINISIMAVFLILIISLSASIKAQSIDSSDSINDANSNFGRIWQAIKELRIEVNKIWNSISDLQKQIDEIELIPGPEGPQGPQGERGEQGPPGISEIRIAVFDITQETQNGVNISCDPNEFATGGGTDQWGDTSRGGILEFYPINERTWYAKSSIILGTPSVGAWNFNEGEGSVAHDFSSDGNDGLIEGAQWSTDTPSGVGYSLFFNNSNSINVGHSPKLNLDRAFTFEAKFKLTPEGDMGPIIYKDIGESPPPYALWIKSFGENNLRSYIELTSASSQVSLKGSTPLERDRWYQVGANYDGATLKLYLDGELDGERPLENFNILDSMDVNHTDTWIGSNHDHGPYPDFRGWLDDVKISNHYYDLEDISNRDYGDLKLVCAKYQ